MVKHTVKTVTVRIGSNAIALKPCPFCGNKAIKIKCVNDDGYHAYQAICPRCGASRIPIAYTEKGACLVWNARKDPFLLKEVSDCETLEQTVS